MAAMAALAALAALAVAVAGIDEDIGEGALPDCRLWKCPWTEI